MSGYFGVEKRKYKRVRVGVTVVYRKNEVPNVHIRDDKGENDALMVDIGDSGKYQKIERYKKLPGHPSFEKIAGSRATDQNEFSNGSGKCEEDNGFRQEKRKQDVKIKSQNGQNKNHN